MTEKIIMVEEDIKRTLDRIAYEILEGNKGAENLALIGIHTRGVPLAYRLAANINKFANTRISVGKMDVTLYRDDNITSVRTRKIRPTDFDDVDNKKIVLVDDVLYTGRTVRAALNEIMDFGRPDLIQLAVLVDRGHREVPIRPDYVGKNIPTAQNEWIYVKLKEKDNVDHVVIGKKL